MIVKVQRELYPGTGPALVYDQSRTVIQWLKLDDEAKSQLGKDPKGYFEATAGAEGVKLVRRVPDESW